MTLGDWALTFCTGGLWLFWVVIRNIYRRDRNKKARMTGYRSHKSVRGGRW